MRRAMSCEYCAPKSRTTMDWVSTDESLKLLCKRKAGKHVGAGKRCCRVHMPLRNIVLSFQSVSCQFLVPLSVLRLYWGQRQIAENRLVLVDLCIVAGGGLRAAGGIEGNDTQRGIRAKQKVHRCL